MESRISPFYIILILTIGIFGFSSCDDDHEDYIPQYEEQVLLEQPDTTYGDLTAEIAYEHNGRLSAAPAGTWVHLYRTSEDMAMGIPMYEFEIYNTDNFIYFGFLASGTYYLLAFTDVGLYSYEGTKSVQVVGNAHRESLVIMNRIITQ
jgi:hypothetical protein